MNDYSLDKLGRLLSYSSGVDYRLPEIPKHIGLQRKFNPYYAYFRVMGMPAPLDASPKIIFAKKKEIITQICLENGVSEDEVPHGYGYKRLKHEIETVSADLTQSLGGKVPSDVLEAMTDAIARRYTPDAVEAVQATVKKITAVFQELYTRSKRYGVLMPKDRQLAAFFSQVTERAFGENTEPLNIFIVACPRYGEHDEYDKLEEGLSQTASTYLYSLPLITSALAKNDIPYRGFILVNDTEEQMANGSLLGRLGLTGETYRAKCKGNVEAVNQAIAEDERITGVSAHLFTEIFPEFVDVTAYLEKQLFYLTQKDADFRLAIAKVADARLSRHTKIMGGQCDFSDSFYLALHYSAEYMALGYLCRVYPQLSSNSFIVNYNSPNVEQFNSQDLLVKSLKGDVLPEAISTIPVFQVKFY